MFVRGNMVCRGALLHDLDASKVHAVECACDVQELRQPAGAFRALHAANEHGFGMALGARHHVEQLVHAVAQVDVGAAARRVQDVRPGRPSLVRMAGRVLLAEIGLRLRDAPPQNRPVRQAAAEELPEQARRKRERIGREVRQASGNGYYIILRLLQNSDAAKRVLPASSSCRASIDFGRLPPREERNLVQ